MVEIKNEELMLWEKGSKVVVRVRSSSKWETRSVASYILLLLVLDLFTVMGDCDSLCGDSSAVSGYIEAARRLACEILDLIADGLWVTDTSVFSRLIRDVDNDSMFRLNHYPPLSKDSDTSPSYNNNNNTNSCSGTKVGFGEHTDPQILTLLTSNDVGGLQISLDAGVWTPVPPDPTAFWVNVGDVLQAMTNGRFKSVRHRAITGSFESRMSIAYFAAPPLNAKITAPPEMVKPESPILYRPFTWAEYKKTTYSLRLGDTRLNLFRLDG